MTKYLMEAIGTFFLVLTIGCTVIPGAPGVIAPLAIGAALMVMIFAGGYLSGAHYNPAVTLGVWIRGRIATADVLPYWVAQIAGALAASMTALYLVGSPKGAPLVPSPMPAFVAEFLFTFALVFVILNVATAEATAGNSFYGLAIGMTVMTGAFAVGSISGGAFNPAVAIGIAVMGLVAPSSIGIHIAAELFAGGAAALVFKIVNPAPRASTVGKVAAS
jgi:aquaporin Z